jgi:hypothetical protein
MTNHPTRLSHRLATGEVEIVTHDEAVVHKATQAQLSGLTVDFVFWANESDEIVEGKVMSCGSADPFTFIVRSEMKNETPKAPIAETARQERAQGGQSQAQSSGDPTVSAAGSHDKPELATQATDGTGMLPTPGDATDNDMAPGG